MKLVLDFEETAKDYEKAKRVANRVRHMIIWCHIKVDVIDSEGYFIEGKEFDRPTGFYAESGGPHIDNFFIIRDWRGNHYTLQSEEIEVTAC